MRRLPSGTLEDEVAMVLVAVVCGFSGLLLGMIANVRALALVAVLVAPAAFLSGVGNDEAFFIGMLWAITGVVTLQIGYVIAIIIRATWFVEASDVRPSVSSP
jgi:hypothetical protein